MPRVMCKFYLNGSCKFGSKCRFLHSSDNQGGYSNDDYYDDYSSGNDYDDRNGYRDNDQYEYDNSNYRSRRNHNPRSNYNRRNDYNQYEENYNYTDNYKSNKYSSQKEQNTQDNYHQLDRRNEYREKKHMNSNYNYEAKYTHQSEEDTEYNNFSFRNPKVNFHNENDDTEEKERQLKYYENQIKRYQLHINQLLESNIWPFTCFHPISNTAPIQPVGCLNFMEVSPEEIRCDYYNIKNMCANPETIHKHSVDEIIMKARLQKEEIISLSTDSAQRDMLATFAKYEQSKNPGFENTIQGDPNSYWDMSLKSIMNQSTNNKSEMESFSFVTHKEKSQTQNAAAAAPLKILMQVETYGQVDCDIFEQENFTDFIPIMPPARKYCI